MDEFHFKINTCCYNNKLKHSGVVFKNREMDWLTQSKINCNSYLLTIVFIVEWTALVRFLKKKYK